MQCAHALNWSEAPEAVFGPRDRRKSIQKALSLRAARVTAQEVVGA